MSIVCRRQYRHNTAVPLYRTMQQCHGASWCHGAVEGRSVDQKQYWFTVDCKVLWSLTAPSVLYVGDSTGTTGAPLTSIKNSLSVDCWLTQQINAQTNTNYNSPSKWARYAWREKDKGAKDQTKGKHSKLLVLGLTASKWCSQMNKWRDVKLTAEYCR